MRECKNCKNFAMEGNIGYCYKKQRVMNAQDFCNKFEMCEMQDFRKSTEEDLIKIYLKLEEIDKKLDSISNEILKDM